MVTLALDEKGSPVWSGELCFGLDETEETVSFPIWESILNTLKHRIPEDLLPDLDEQTFESLTTRGDLGEHPDFSHLGTDSIGVPNVWHNEYVCEECCFEFEDDWSCQVDQECTRCGVSNMPSESTWRGPDDPWLEKLFYELPENPPVAQFMPA